MYKLNENSITRLSDGVFIPLANGNRDYEEYKQWLVEGNTPQPQYTPEELTAKETAEANAKVLEALEKLDKDSIRAMREWIAAQPTAPQILKDKESLAAAERAKLK